MILEPGTYKGSNCSIEVIHETVDHTRVVVTDGSKSDGFSIMNVMNSRGYVVAFNEAELSLSAAFNLSFPRYMNGGTSHFSARTLSNGDVRVSISNVLFDHRGEDMSTYVSCVVGR